jgi:hypothetical protein
LLALLGLVFPGGAAMSMYTTAPGAIAIAAVTGGLVAVLLTVALTSAWERGLVATLDYGVRSDDTDDPETAVLWSKLERLYDLPATQPATAVPSGPTWWSRWTRAARETLAECPRTTPWTALLILASWVRIPAGSP